MKAWIFVVAILFTLGTVIGMSLLSCGDDDGCPGIVCTDCGGSGDCDVTCTGDDVEYCGHFGYFDDLDLRCAFCASVDYEI